MFLELVDFVLKLFLYTLYTAAGIIGFCTVCSLVAPFTMPAIEAMYEANKKRKLSSKQ